MNILHVAGTDLRGARFNGYAMKPVAARRGHRLRLAVWDRQSDDPDVISFRAGPPRYAQSAWARANRLLGLDDLIAPAAFTLLRHPWFAEADLLHAHLIDHDWFGVALIPLIARRKPLVVTVHSAIAATGGCYYPRECPKWRTGCNGDCPHPRGLSPLHRRTPALNWRAKRLAYRHTDMTLVAASQWTAGYLARGPLTRHLPCHIIPFGLDLGVFHPDGKQAARSRLAIAPDETVLAFRGVDVERDEVKGGAWLLRTLADLPLPGPVTLLILDDARSFTHLAGRYRIINRGWARTDTEVAETMRAADIFLMPSLAESFGMMAVEAMACGVPVIVGSGTSLPEVIHAPQGGLTVPPNDQGALAAAIIRLTQDDSLRTSLSQKGRAIVEQHYRLETYVDRHLELYADLIEQRARAPQRLHLSVHAGVGSAPGFVDHPPSDTVSGRATHASRNHTPAPPSDPVDDEASLRTGAYSTQTRRPESRAGECDRGGAPPEASR